jgi:peptide-methionine (S)-S-oxide reductase
VGYTGGVKANPTYYSLGDHTETVEIDYDPTVVSYEELLEVFWQSHRPTTPSWSRQYASIIFYHDEEQLRLATESKQRAETRWGRKIYTEITPAKTFYLAEDYHQKYYLRNLQAVEREFLATYPELADFVDSTAVARANGYIGGYGDAEQVERDLTQMGLSPEAQERLRQAYSRHH